MEYLRNELPAGLLIPGLMLLFGLAGLVMSRLLMAGIRWLAKRNASSLYQFNVARLRRPVYMLVPAFMVLVALRLAWPDARANAFYDGALKLVAVSFVYWVAISVLDVVTLAVIRRYDITVKDNLRARRIHTQILVVKRIISFIIALLALAAIFMLFEQLRGLGISLLASAGMAGIIIGFAAQKTLGNLFAGIQIALTQPIRIEDAIVVEGEWGWVEEITLTYVVIRLWDLRRLVLPIAYFIEKPFQNWTRNSATIIGTVELFADYSLPIDPLRSKLVDLLAATDLWDGATQVVQVTECERDVIRVRILVSASDSPTAFDLRCYVREHMVAFIEGHYPQCLPKTRAILEAPHGGNQHPGPSRSPA